MTTLRSLRKIPLDLYCMDRSTPYFSDPFAPVEEHDSPWKIDPPTGWTYKMTRQWTYFTPQNSLADQGWKIHVCATMEVAFEVLKEVASHCFGSGLHFKHLTTPSVLELSNSKYASRASSGKFITIYPATLEQLTSTLRDLEEVLGGYPGPYILSDHRWKQGPLYLRYGAFRHLPLQDRLGHEISGLRRPDGSLVPDLRVPYFEVPPWVEIPTVIQQSLTDKDEEHTMFYDFTEALHFSNGGGVYRATQKSSGTPCIIKEARPHAGLDGLRHDATIRLEREAEALSALESVTGVPHILDQFSCWEHTFIAMEQMNGVNLRQWAAQHSPEVRPGSTDESRAEYGRQCEKILDRLADLIQRIHWQGWIHGDIHPNNVLVTDDLQVSLLDFEQSYPIVAAQRPGLGARGFTRPHHGGRPLSVADDFYGLASIALWLFTPLQMILRHRPRLAARLVGEVRQKFRLSADWVQLVEEHLLEVIREDYWITSWSGEDSMTPEVGQLKKESILALTAQLETGASDDYPQSHPLFPGDVHQLITDQVNLSSGAAGPLYALQCAGRPLPEWALDRLYEQTIDLRHPGLLCGMAGPALVLQRAGREDQARVILDYAVRLAATRTDTTLSTGRAGVILALLSEEFGLASDLVERAVDLAKGLENGAVYDARTPTGNAAGLAEGYSGAAVACARLSRLLRSEEWAVRGLRLFERDLDCTEVSDGMRLVSEDGNLYPYLAHGAAGLLLAGGELRVCGADLDTTVFSDLMRSLDVESTVEAGLYDGSLGLAAALQHLASLGLEVPSGLIQRHLLAAGDFAVDAPVGGQVLVGRKLCALSFDYSTGAAGWLTVALAVERCASPLPAFGSSHLPPIDPFRSVQPLTSYMPTCLILNEHGP